MNVVITKADRRPDKPNLFRRIHALVDGGRVIFRNEPNRRWSCHICDVRSQARCKHVDAVRKELNG